ncbi:DoxX family protein [Snuella sedimenti]|uniref:DoxX family protein n=1 Tax=Snuella sedimenti TaxID=2798802 RepID=A0A8J7J4R4_9FLAO|nr:DoxX family protein [Snuella sedimenti]MBJ6368528.1 DoxX family protein [Snuella sedimenti]
MKKTKIIYYVSTGLLSLLILFSASMYFFKHDDVSKMFANFGYPSYIIYPYAVAKLLGVFAIWNTNFKALKEWAYSGFFFAFILAFFAHYMIGDGQQTGAFLALTLLIVAYVSNYRINKLGNSIKK